MVALLVPFEVQCRGRDCTTKIPVVTCCIPSYCSDCSEAAVEQARRQREQARREQQARQQELNRWVSNLNLNGIEDARVLFDACQRRVGYTIAFGQFRSALRKRFNVGLTVGRFGLRVRWIVSAAR